jgi:GTP-binding protein
MTTDRWVDYLRESFSTMWHVPIAFITGQTGKNVKALLNHAQNLFKQSLQRVSTSELNRLVRAALTKHPPPMHGMLRPKIYYATQVSTQPPTIVLISNEPKAFQSQYRRYLLSVLRDNLSFGEVPIKMYLQTRRRDERDDLEAGEDTAAEVAAMRRSLAARRTDLELEDGSGGLRRVEATEIRLYVHGCCGIYHLARH